MPQKSTAIGSGRYWPPESLVSVPIPPKRNSRFAFGLIVLKRRRRVVTFRVSDEEYEALRQSCLESGFHSISDFARSAVVDRVSLAGAPQGLLAGNLSTLTRQLAGLDKALGDVREHIQQVLGGVTSEDTSETG